MKIVIFGGSGFIGSHVADALSDNGHAVAIYDLTPSPYLRDDQEMIIADITNAEQVVKAMAGADYVYNFAGVADLDEGCVNPVMTAKLNVLGNLNVLEAARNAGVKKVLYASTIYVYSDKGGFYRVSKQSSELYIEQYQRAYGLDYTILRYGTLYGPRADQRNSVYRYLLSAMTEKRLSVGATGDERREYIHVRDAARLSVDCLSSHYDNMHITITGHQNISFKELLLMIDEMFGGIALEFRGENNAVDHYRRTPYSFSPKVGYKLTSPMHVDMGQGLLETIDDMIAKGVTISSPKPTTC